MQNADGSITDGKGNTIKIGDYVNYSCKSSTATYTSPASRSGYTGDQVFRANSYNYGWRVLGVDKETKQLQLISEDFVQPTTGGIALVTRQAYTLKGQAGYENGVEELNNICAIYGTGEGARTINVEDVDWITGYNPNNTGVKDKNKTGSGTKYSSNQMNEYRNTVEYTLLTTGIQYTSKGNSATGGILQYNHQFIYHDPEVTSGNGWKNLAMNGSVTLKSNTYFYYPTTLTDTDDKTVIVGIGVNTPEYKMLFTNSSTGADIANREKTDNFYYWLGSSCVSTNSGHANFGLRVVISGYVSYSTLYNSDGNTNPPCYGIRPVVTLDSKVTLKDSGTMKDGCKLYNLVHN